jgi:uncharacterized membrane protein
MKKNVGTIDRIIRLIAGIVFLLVSYSMDFSGTLGIVFIVLGIVMLLTSAISFCGFYPLLGINTCKKD